MKKILAIALAAALVGGLAPLASARGGWGGGHMMWDRDNGYGRGQGMNPGWMHGRDFDDRGRGYGPGYCRTSFDARGTVGRVDKAETAVEIVARQLEDSGNPNLKAGKVTETGRDFEVDVVTKDGSLANKVLVEKATGRILPAYGN